MSQQGEEVPPWRTATPRVVVVLPAYNEEQSLGVLLRRLDQSMYSSMLRRSKAIRL